MEESPDLLKVAVLSTFVAKLMAMQLQLDPQYQSATFLRDRLITAVDIPLLQTALRDRFIRKSKQAVNLVANQLPDSTRSARSGVVYDAQEDANDEDE